MSGVEESKIEEIRSTGITNLKKMAKDLGISGYSKFSSGNKKQLENIIIKYLKGGEAVDESQKIVSKSKKPVVSQTTKVKYTPDFLQKKTVVDLKLMAKSIGLVGFSKLKKDELIKAILDVKSSKKQEKEEKEEVKSGQLDLYSMTVKDLQDLLKSKGITVGLTTKSKEQLIELINAPTCNPVENKYCEDGQICDIRNNVCVKSKINNLFEMTINNKKVLGTKKGLEELSNILKKQEREEEKKVYEKQEVIGELEEKKPLSPFFEPEPIQDVKEEEEEEEEVMVPQEIPEGESELEILEEKVEEIATPLVKPPPLMESDDIQKVLSDILEGGDDFSEILDQDAREKMIFRCLSLLK